MTLITSFILTSWVTQGFYGREDKLQENQNSQGNGDFQQMALETSKTYDRTKGKHMDVLPVLLSVLLSPVWIHLLDI